MPYSIFIINITIFGIKSITMAEQLIKLLEFCTTRDIGFDYLHSETSTKNTIEYFESEKKVVITIYDPDDELLSDLISKKLEFLKNLFN